ncbi:MAG TPA: beta-galactosidase [Bryobacteraceae bacterium]|nr:beta-galactosidase [Bryobacteraceae bacterium]
MRKQDWNRRQFLGTSVAAATAATAARTPAHAQDVGMGARKGSSKRLETPYTLEIETPHVKWAKPLLGGPIRLLAVSSVDEGRTVVELAQRLSLDLTTVSIDPAWDVNKWTMCFGRDYGARAERGDLNLVYSYLEQELTSTKQFDAILLPLSHGWKALTSASREALARRVKEGSGLVLIRPFSSEICPLEPTTAPPESEDELEVPREPGKTESSPWHRKGEHYITRAVPVESFPFQHLDQYICRAAAGAEVLIESETGHAILAAHTYGSGRVAAFGYRNAGVSWYMPQTARNDFVDTYWEYFYSLLCRALIYVAKREPAAIPDWEVPSTEWRVRDLRSRIRDSGQGPTKQSQTLEGGRYFLEQQNGAEWRITVLDVQQSDRVEELKASKEIISEGDAVDVTWKSTRRARIELIDGLGRVIARSSGEDKARLKAGKPLVHSGWVRATAGSAVAQIPVRFAASSREWKDYEILLPWFGPRSYQPWIPTVDEQLRSIGITTLARPERNFKIMASVHPLAFGIYWYRRDGYLKRKKAFAETGDKKYLTREVVLQSPEFEKSVKASLEKNVRPVAALKPWAYYLADESSLTCYTDPFDVDWAPEAIAGLRQWLRKEYGSLEKLNSAWGTSFQEWDSVVPMTTEEAQKHGNFAPWSDHRVYMEQEFVQAFAKAREWLREIDPEGRPSISGTQIPTAHNGCNWYEIDQQLEYIQPYSGGSQDAMHYLFNPKLQITGFTGYGLVGDEAKHQQWQRLFYGHTGASIFWYYTLMNPDLTLSEQGAALADAFGRLQSGIGRIFMNSKVREDGVAVHFSMASIRGAWITDGKLSADMGNVMRSSKNFAELNKLRNAWVEDLERQGLQLRFLATPQIEAGDLKNYRVLILPYSIALSDREIQEIERFMDRGGVVYADEQTGKMDERCRWRKAVLWQHGRKGLIRRGPGDIELESAVPTDGKFLVTVRDFGGSRLIGLLPKEKAIYKLPPMEGVIYDLIRGETARGTLEATPGTPVLLLARQSAITRLDMDANLNLRLLDAAGAPVDRSVVHVEVFNPEDRLVREYCMNVDIVNGAGRIEIPFAMSDARGAWRIRVRDAISGLGAERTLTPKA